MNLVQVDDVVVQRFQASLGSPQHLFVAQVAAQHLCG